MTKETLLKDKARIEAIAEPTAQDRLTLLKIERNLARYPSDEPISKKGKKAEAE